MSTPERIELMSLSEKRKRLAEIGAEAMLIAATLEDASSGENGAGQGSGPRWLTSSQAVEYAQVCRSTLYLLAKKGLLHPSPRVGRWKRWDRLELDQLPETIGTNGGPGK